MVKHAKHMNCNQLSGGLQLRIKTAETKAQTVAPYSASFGRTLVGAIVASPDEGVGLVRTPSFCQKGLLCYHQ
jgi:hypothetical protein